MKLLSRFTLTGLIAVLVLAASPLQATIHNISVFNFDFSPHNTQACLGDTIRWTWNGGSHIVASDGSSPKAFTSPLFSIIGSTYNLILTGSDPVGAYPYHCGIHLEMQDTIFVSNCSPTIFTFLLDDDQEVGCAGTGSSATGFGIAILDTGETKLSVYVEHNVIGANAAHIHFGAPCVDGGPIRFGFTSAASPIHQTWNLSPANVAELLAGNLYVNIHSGAFPNGEIRGQIVQAPIKFVFTLDEAQALAGAGSNSLASGLAICELNPTSTNLNVKVTHDVASTIDGHVHFGLPGVEGAIRFGFSSSLSPINQNWALDTLNLKDLMQGELYINIHSTAFPTGEIRGQLKRQDVLVSMLMNGALANGGAGTGSTKVGFTVATLSANLKTLSMHTEHNVASPIDAHVHFGAPNVEGPIRFGFSSPASPSDEVWNLTATDVTDLLAGNLYINIHSTPFPSGEIRGQLVLDKTHTYTVTLNQAQANACAGTGSAATGNCTAKLKPGSREFTIDLTHNVALAIDGHVHRGDTCVTGPIVFGFSSPASPIRETWYLTAADIIDLFQNQLYVNVHSTPFPNEEIRGQLGVPPAPPCKCGDADGNGTFNISDAVKLINYIFSGGAAPNPLCRGDADGNGSINVSDAVKLINFIFSGGGAPHCP
jgi:plastocyanin